MMQLRYTWSTGAGPTLSDYLPTPEAIDEAARTLAEHNRPGSKLTVDRIECHGPDSGRWFVLWRVDGCAADDPDAYTLTLTGPGAIGPAAGLGHLDGAPLGLDELAAVLRATRAAAAEEQHMVGTPGHTILTATDTVRSRQISRQALVGLAPVDDWVRVQVARAVCAVVFGGKMPADPVVALLRWQRGVIGDRGALTRVLGTAVERVEALAAITRAAAKLEAAPDEQR